jgi:hypothetical protein
MSEQPNPSRKVTVEDDNVSQDSITTLVEKRENGIDIVTLTASNEDGSNYLSTLHLNDEVKVKMVKDSNPPYTPAEEDTFWNTNPLVKTVFRGRIQELSPILNKAGQVCRVVALGHGYQLKEMKVNKKYGAIVPLFSLGNTYGYEEEDNDWFLLGYSPYIDSYVGNFFSLFGKGLFNIYCHLHGNIDQEIGAFTFMVDPEYDGIEFDTVELHVVAAIYGDLTSANVMPYYSIDGSTWHKFTGDLQFNITTKLPSRPEPDGWSDLVGYNPMVQVAPFKGQDISIDIKTDLSYWNKNFRIKLKIVGIGGTPAYEDEVSIKYMWLEYIFKTSAGKTVRQIIAGDEHTDGIIENYVNNILGDTTKPSGYNPTINTDWVYGFTETEEEYKIPYINFPYQDALISLQDIIKYASSLKFLVDSCGYHWIITPDGELLVAPVNNHTVFGLDIAHLIEAKWALYPYATPLKVKQDMVTQAFKQEVPLANYILVAGRYKYPLNDEICKGLDIGLWETNGGIGFGTRRIYLDTYDVGANGACLTMKGCYNPIAAVNNIYAYPLPEDIDLAKLMGKETTPSIFFILKAGGYTTDFEFRLYFEDPDNIGHPDQDNYFKYVFGDTVQDSWVAKEIGFPNTLWNKDFKGWELVTIDGSKDWKDFVDVKFFAFRFNSMVGLLEEATCKVLGIAFNGVVIYGLYDSTSIHGPITVNGITYPNGFGCRMITIKDTYAITDTLDIDDIASTPLGLECLYELVRYRKLRITGEVAIPLDPIYMAGQQVWIQAEDYIPIGSTVLSDSGDPTTATVGEIGNYYVNTDDDEVFLCIDIQAGPTYIWTDKNTLRYKINKWFRITKVSHEFNATGALTRLQVTDDLESSIPIDTTDAYTVVMRAINIDFATRTQGSLKSLNDFDQGLEPITADHPS